MDWSRLLFLLMSYCLSFRQSVLNKHFSSWMLAAATVCYCSNSIHAVSLNWACIHHNAVTLFSLTILVYFIQRPLLKRSPLCSHSWVLVSVVTSHTFKQKEFYLQKYRAINKRHWKYWNISKVLSNWRICNFVLFVNIINSMLCYVQDETVKFSGSERVQASALSNNEGTNLLDDLVSCVLAFAGGS